MPAKICKWAVILVRCRMKAAEWREEGKMHRCRAACTVHGKAPALPDDNEIVRLRGDVGEAAAAPTSQTTKFTK